MKLLKHLPELNTRRNIEMSKVVKRVHRLAFEMWNITEVKNVTYLKMIPVIYFVFNDASKAGVWSQRPSLTVKYWVKKIIYRLTSFELLWFGFNSMDQSNRLITLKAK